MYKTFDEYERIAYMSNMPKLAALYAELDDSYRDGEIERLNEKINDLKFECSKHEETFEKLAKITEIINE